MDGGDEDLFAAKAVEDDVRGASDDELAEVRLTGGATEGRVEAMSFDKGDDAGGEALGGAGIIERNVGANLAQACSGDRRPNNLNREKAFGGGPWCHGNSS